MQQNYFEFLQKLPQNPLPLCLLTSQNAPITPIPRPNYFPFSSRNLNFKNNLFYQPLSYQNSSHFNFAKSHDFNSSPFFHPSLLTSNPLVMRDLLSQQFFSSPAFQIEQRKVKFLFHLFPTTFSKGQYERLP